MELGFSWRLRLGLGQDFGFRFGWIGVDMTLGFGFVCVGRGEIWAGFCGSVGLGWGWVGEEC